MVLFLSLLAFYSEIQGWVLGTLIFSYIRRLGPFFWVQNFEFQYFWGFSEKMNTFGGMMKMRIFLGVITKDDEMTQ